MIIFIVYIIYFANLIVLPSKVYDQIEVGILFKFG